MTAAGATSLGYDARGNITSSGSDSFGYSAENLLTSSTVASVSTTYQYDPMLRLAKVISGPTTEAKFLYDGTNMVAGYTYSAFNKRFVFGPGADEVLVQYDGSGTGAGVRNCGAGLRQERSRTDVGCYATGARRSATKSRKP